MCVVTKDEKISQGKMKTMGQVKVPVALVIQRMVQMLHLMCIKRTESTLKL